MELAGSSARRPPASPGALRLVGCVATAAALAALWAASSVAPGAPFPPAALAEAVVRATPGDIATFFIDLLHHWAARALTAAAVVGAFLVGAQALVSTARGGRPRPLLAAGVLVALSAVVSLGSGFAVDPVATSIALALAAVAYIVAAKLVHRVTSVQTPTDEARRRAIKLGVGGAMIVALGGGALAWVARRLGGPDTEVALAAPDVRASVPQRPPWPAVAGLTREVTSAAKHYVVDINLVRPVVEVDGWNLAVRGEVDRPLDLTFGELQRRFRFVEEYAVLACVSNEVGGELVGHSLWGGVRLRDVLEAAGLRAGVVDLVFRAADGYSDSIPAALARDPDVLLAIAQNRRPLTQDHGFPCRLRVPPIYGMKNVKWIESIEAVRGDYEGYWQERGWSDEAVVRTQSRIDVAGDGFSAARGRATWVAGVAWAGDRGVSRVEISTDGGRSWNDAELREPIGPLSWRQWVYRWTPAESGTATVTCRATDGRGDIQTADTAPPHPAGATGLHTVTLQVG
jgi:DMSO/TMAO reductase YedYZ molybdopterin-dependent catalytic subunit